MLSGVHVRVATIAGNVPPLEFVLGGIPTHPQPQSPSLPAQ